MGQTYRCAKNGDICKYDGAGVNLISENMCNLWNQQTLPSRLSTS